MTPDLSEDCSSTGGRKFPSPPRWAETLLIDLLKPRDSETIPGDLLEEYREERLPALGRARADFWYIRQVISIASVQTFEGGPMRSTLLCLCCFTLAATAWLGVMETVLHHPGFALRIFCAVLLAGQSMATILFLTLRGRGRPSDFESVQLRPDPVMFAIFRGHGRLHILLIVGGALILVFGISAVVSILKASHFEGYALLIGAALVVQGALTIVTLAFVRNSRIRS